MGKLDELKSIIKEAVREEISDVVRRELDFYFEKIQRQLNEIKEDAKSKVITGDNLRKVTEAHSIKPTGYLSEIVKGSEAVKEVKIPDKLGDKEFSGALGDIFKSMRPEDIIGVKD